jgi:hypothetical protein
VKQYEAKPIRILARSENTRFGGFFHGRFLPGRNGVGSSRRRYVVGSMLGKDQAHVAVLHCSLWK